jgi:phosphoribosylamine--glycine ligase
LEGYELSFDQKTSLGVVLAANGYPDQYDKGHPISGLSSQVTNTKVFHAGTAVKDKKVVTNGGRVLCVASLGEDILEARTKAYERIDLLDWDGMFFRKDIGHKAVSRQ